MTQQARQPCLVLFLSFFLVACGSIQVPNVTPTVTPIGHIQIYTTQPVFTGMGNWELVISNTTAATITIPTPRYAQAGEATYRFYQKDIMGWQRLIARPGYMADVYYEYTRPDNSKIQIAGQSSFTLNFTPVMGIYFALPGMDIGDRLEGIFLIQVRYQPDPVLTTTNELVQYTNEFTITGTRPVNDLEFAVKVNHPQRDRLEVQNNSTETLWVPSICSQENIYDDDDYTSLQRLTSEGTWEIFRPRASLCQKSLSAILIAPGNLKSVEADQWIPLDVDLPPGIYRWDVVILLRNKQPGYEHVQDIRHIFSPAFVIPQ